MKDETVKSITAMAGITLLVAVGVLTGHNGVVLGTGLGLLSGLGGYFVGRRGEE